MSFKKIINYILGTTGYTIVNKRTADKMYISFDINPEFKDVFYATESYTMTTPERMFALYNAINYVVDHNIPGDIVECGVYKGGSMMLAAHTLKQRDNKDRNLYLYDTFTGMDEPTADDIFYGEKEDARAYYNSRKRNEYTDWIYAPLEEVQQNMESTGYPKEKIHYVKGRVEDTIPETAPDTISILRLDTDFYQSTKHELKHLFPKLSQNGIIIIDDYGSWKGARKAVDEYFSETAIPPFLVRCDHSCAVGVKTQ